MEDIPRETKMQYSIIARKRHAHVDLQHAQLIRAETWEQLMLHVSTEDIEFIEPNFVIYIQDHRLQHHILSQTTLQTRNFRLDLTPWSRENELAQLPWITDAPIDNTDISIDPLTILPVLLSTTIAEGNKSIKNDYAKLLGDQYELRAPDFSYLMIIEIKEFYRQRQMCLYRCRNIVKVMGRSLEQFSSKLNDLIDEICINIHELNCGDDDATTEYLENSANWLQQLLFNTNADSNTVCSLVTSANQRLQTRMNIQDYRETWHPLKTPLPPVFVSRLKKIHAMATRVVYGEEAILATQETPDGKFETFMTIGNLTSKYDEIPLKTPATPETLAVCHSLKYITNVLGYRIVDLHYPVLQKLVVTINQQNGYLSMFDHCISRMKRNIHRTHTAILSLDPQIRQVTSYVPHLVTLHEKMDHLVLAIEEYEEQIQKHCFHYKHKDRYMSTVLETESPSLGAHRWN